MSWRIRGTAPFHQREQWRHGNDRFSSFFSPLARRHPNGIWMFWSSRSIVFHSLPLLRPYPHHVIQSAAWSPPPNLQLPWRCFPPSISISSHSVHGYGEWLCVWVEFVCCALCAGTVVSNIHSLILSQDIKPMISWSVTDMHTGTRWWRKMYMDFL